MTGQGVSLICYFCLLIILIIVQFRSGLVMRRLLAEAGIATLDRQWRVPILGYWRRVQAVRRVRKHPERFPRSIAPVLRSYRRLQFMEFGLYVPILVFPFVAYRMFG
jgi:hypothetical protein